MTAKKNRAYNGPAEKFNESGLAIWVLLFAAMLILNAVVELARLIVSQTTIVEFEVGSDTNATIDFDGAATQAADGFVSIAVSAGELAGGTLTFLIISLVVWIVGLIVASLYGSIAVNAISRGNPFADRTVSALGRVFWVLTATMAVSGIAGMLGNNMVQRDLGLTELSDLQNSVSTEGIFAALSVLGFVMVLRYALARGRDAERELDGLV